MRAREPKYTIEQVRKIVEKRRGKCLTKEYPIGGRKLRIICGMGHLWEPSPYSVLNGRWCRICSGNTSLGISELKNIARKRGGRCISKVYTRNQDHLFFECKERHKWKATPSNIKRGKWCPECAKKTRAEKTRLTIEHFKKLAAKRGGECLSKTSEENRGYLLWKCEKNHLWRAHKGHMKSAWCPECGELRRVIAKLSRSLKEARKIAAKRGGKCLSNNVAPLQGPAKFQFECRERHRWIGRIANIKKGAWCPECGDEQLRLGLREMQKIADSHGGECLSKKYFNIEGLLLWRCKKGHDFKLSAKSVKHSKSWCPECRVSKFTPLDLQKLARSRNGTCLEIENDIGPLSKVEWCCARGHEWTATYRQAVMSWCPICCLKR